MRYPSWLVGVAGLTVATSFGLIGCSEEPAAAPAGQAQNAPGAGAAMPGQAGMPGGMPGQGAMPNMAAPGAGGAVPGVQIAGTPGTAPIGTPGTAPIGTLGTAPIGAPGTAPIGTPGTAPIGTPGTAPIGTPGTAPAAAVATNSSGVPGSTPASAPSDLTAAAQPGAVPGAAPGAGISAPGQPGGQSGQPGQSQTPTAPEGTADFAAQKVVLQLLAGDAKGLSEFISPKCKGILGDVRDGKVTEQQVDELKKTFTNVNLVGKPRKESGATVYTLRNGDGATITLRVKKEKDSEDFRLTEYTVKAPASKKSR